MYAVISIISLYIRTFLLPNPFTPMLQGLTIDYMGMSIPIPTAFSELVVMGLFESLIFSVTYSFVGFYYNKGIDHPAYGSFLYLIFYIFHLGLIYFMSCFFFAWWSVIAAVLVFFGIHVVINAIRSKLSYGW